MLLRVVISTTWLHTEFIAIVHTLNNEALWLIFFSQFPRVNNLPGCYLTFPHVRRVHQTQRHITEPLNYEGYVSKNMTILRNDPHRELLLFPLDDVEVRMWVCWVRVPKYLL